MATRGTFLLHHKDVFIQVSLGTLCMSELEYNREEKHKADTYQPKRAAKVANQDYEWIGTCPAGKYLGNHKVLNPYWQKLDFLQRNPQSKNPADDSTSTKHVSLPDISSSGQTPSTFETGQDSNLLLSNGGSDTSHPLAFGNGLSPTTSPSFLEPLAEFSSPDGGLAGQDYASSNKFIIKRSRKQQRRRRV